MRHSEILDTLALLGQPDNPESNPYGLLAVLLSDGQQHARLLFGFLKEVNYGSELILDVPGYVNPVTLAMEQITVIKVPSRRLMDERLSLGFLDCISPDERRKWLEIHFHVTGLDPKAEIFRWFPGTVYDLFTSVRNYCRRELLFSPQWTVIVSPSWLYDGGSIRCRVFIPDDGTIDLFGYSGFGTLLGGIDIPNSILDEIRSVQKRIKKPREWEEIPWQKISDASGKSLSVIAYDKGSSPIGYTRIGTGEYVPAF